MRNAIVRNYLKLKGSKFIYQRSTQCVLFLMSALVYFNNRKHNNTKSHDEYEELVLIHATAYVR